MYLLSTQWFISTNCDNLAPNFKNHCKVSQTNSEYQRDSFQRSLVIGNRSFLSAAANNISV